MAEPRTWASAASNVSDQTLEQEASFFSQLAVCILDGSLSLSLSLWTCFFSWKLGIKAILTAHRVGMRIK